MMLWPLVIVVAVGLLLGVLLVLGPRVFPGARSVAISSLQCPLRHRPFDVEFRVTAWEGHAVDVLSCSAFMPPTAVTCEKLCLFAGRARPAAGRAAVVGVLLVGSLTMPAPLAAGDIAGTVRLAGAPPASSTVQATTDHAICGAAARPATPLDLGADQGIQEAVVFLAHERLEDWKLPATTFVIDQRGCEFVPRVLIVPPGATVEVRNSDGILHTFHTRSNLNPRLNLAQRAGGRPLRVRFERAEVIEARCDVHGEGFMRGWIIVAAHPYYALTDVDGRYRLPGVPPGPHTLAAWHARLGQVTAPVSVGASGETRVDMTFPGATASGAPRP